MTKFRLVVTTTFYRLFFTDYVLPRLRVSPLLPFFPSLPPLYSRRVITENIIRKILSVTEVKHRSLRIVLRGGGGQIRRLISTRAKVDDATSDH